MTQQRSRRRSDRVRAGITVVLIAALGLFGGRPGAWAQSIDTCLVGNWEATTIVMPGGQYPPEGGTGFRVTITSDGTETVDYATMKPFLWTKTQNTDAQYWRGSATLRISTDQGVVSVESVAQNNVEVQVSRVLPNYMPGWPGRLGPGVLGNLRKSVAYNCNGASLQYETFNDGGTAWCTVQLKRMTAAVLAAEPVNVNGSTWLTATEIRNREQDLEGVWTEDGIDPPLWWVTVSPDGTLEDHPMPSRDPTLASIKMKRFINSAWRGEVYVCPRNGQCPNLCRWVEGSLQIGENNLSGVVDWRGKQSKTDCSGFQDEPDSGVINMKRFVGVSFTPLVAGKYMELVGAPAVGNQSAQFKAAARLTALYESLSPAEVRTVADRGSITLIDKAKGTYQFQADQSGTFELRFELLGNDGNVFHTDRVRIDIPGIPGVGR